MASIHNTSAGISTSTTPPRPPKLDLPAHLSEPLIPRHHPSTLGRGPSILRPAIQSSYLASSSSSFPSPSPSSSPFAARRYNYNHGTAPLTGRRPGHRRSRSFSLLDTSTRSALSHVHASHDTDSVANRTLEDQPWRNRDKWLELHSNAKASSNASTPTLRLPVESDRGWRGTGGGGTFFHRLGYGYGADGQMSQHGREKERDRAVTTTLMDSSMSTSTSASAVAPTSHSPSSSISPSASLSSGDTSTVTGLATRDALPPSVVSERELHESNSRAPVGMATALYRQKTHRGYNEAGGIGSLHDGLNSPASSSALISRSSPIKAAPRRPLPPPPPADEAEQRSSVIDFSLPPITTGSRSPSTDPAILPDGSSSSHDVLIDTDQRPASQCLSRVDTITASSHTHHGSGSTVETCSIRTISSDRAHGSHSHSHGHAHGLALVDARAHLEDSESDEQVRPESGTLSLPFTPPYAYGAHDLPVIVTPTSTHRFSPPVPAQPSRKAMMVQYDAAHYGRWDDTVTFSSSSPSPRRVFDFSSTSRGEGVYGHPASPDYSPTAHAPPSVSARYRSRHAPSDEPRAHTRKPTREWGTHTREESLPPLLPPADRFRRAQFVSHHSASSPPAPSSPVGFDYDSPSGGIVSGGGGGMGTMRDPTHPHSQESSLPLDPTTASRLAVRRASDARPVAWGMKSADPSGVVGSAGGSLGRRRQVGELKGARSMRELRGGVI